MESLGKLFGFVVRLHFIKLHQTISSQNLGKGQPPILAYLTEHDGCIQSEIAKCERKTAATMTVMLQTMEKNGLIERRPDNADHRTQRVYITDKGREAHKKAEAALVKMEQEVYSDFTDEEKVEFMRLLKKMEDTLACILNMDEEKTEGR